MDDDLAVQVLHTAQCITTMLSGAATVVNNEAQEVPIHLGLVDRQQVDSTASLGIPAQGCIMLQAIAGAILVDG